MIWLVQFIFICLLGFIWSAKKIRPKSEAEQSERSTPAFDKISASRYRKFIIVATQGLISYLYLILCLLLPYSASLYIAVALGIATFGLLIVIALEFNGRVGLAFVGLLTNAADGLIGIFPTSEEHSYRRWQGLFELTAVMAMLSAMFGVLGTIY